MMLARGFRTQIERLHKEVRRFLDGIDALESEYVTEGMSALERDAAHQRAFPLVQQYAVKNGAPLVELAAAGAQEAKELPARLVAAARAQKVLPAELAEIEALGTAASKRLWGVFSSLEIFLGGIVRELAGSEDRPGYFPGLARDTLRAYIVKKTPEYEKEYIDNLLDPLETAEASIAATAVR